MRILHLTADDGVGGAGRAAWRLHQALRDAGADSTMLVRRRHSPDPAVTERDGRLARAIARWRPLLDEVPVALYRRRAPVHFSAGWFPSRIARDVRRRAPDLVHLHWINNGFVGITDLAGFRRPIVWTFHDSWPLTGGCHYHETCRRFTERCGACPWLNAHCESDLSRAIWRLKRWAWRRANLTGIAPSQWMAERARASSIWADRPIVVIPNIIPLDVFAPRPRAEARAQVGWPVARPMILYIAMNALADHNKGFDLLQRALADPWPAGSIAARAALAVAGADAQAPLPALGLPARNIGPLRDDARLAAWLAAADVVVVPSRVENLPNIVGEALACGTPVTAFRMGGLPEMITHGETGYLATPYDPADLRRGIEWAMERVGAETVRHAARRAAETRFSAAPVVRAHLDLYRRLLKEHPRDP